MDKVYQATFQALLNDAQAHGRDKVVSQTRKSTEGLLESEILKFLMITMQVLASQLHLQTDGNRGLVLPPLF